VTRSGTASALTRTAALLLLAGCATAPLPLAPTAPQNHPLAFADLPGWAAEDHLAALAAVRAACRLRRDAALGPVCARLGTRPPSTDAGARAFLEANFQPEAVAGEGLLTAYFSPEYEARLQPEAPFTAPVRQRPALPAAGAGAPPDRAAIEAEPADDALAWMRPEDLFFLQIQGSGVLDLPGGRRLRAVYAGSNGLPFVGVARVMRDEGLIQDSGSSGEAIRGWLADHRGPEADAIMQRNPRYVYFTLRPDDGASPAGAAGVPLPPGRAVAADPASHPMGELLWIDAEAPALTGAVPAYRRLVAALDVGSAIKGEARLDLFVGSGEAAGREAGRVRHRLRLYRLAPRPEPAS
jgi:membrane-bound lytic murein transglycosylase A